jgi:hypothetical protein
MRQHQPADDHDGGKDLRRFGRGVFSATLTRVCNWPEEGMTFHCLNSTVVSGARSRDCLLSSQAYRRRARNDPPDPRQVRTKNAKTFTSVFFPVSDDFHDIAVNWIRYLREENSFGPDDPLFPRPGSRTAATSNFAVSPRILKPRCMTLSRCFAAPAPGGPRDLTRDIAHRRRRALAACTIHRILPQGECAQHVEAPRLRTH